MAFCLCKLHDMRYLSPFFAFLFFSSALCGQIGFSGSYAPIKAKDWETFLSTNKIKVEDGKFLETGYKIGVNYWHRLKDARIEFLPELSASIYRETLINNEIIADLRAGTELNIYSLQYHTNIYPFDITGDCDCPTFSKKGPTLQKGFFIQLSPGINLLQAKIQPSSTLPVEFSALEETGALFSLGAGLGFDLGLSDLVTISPFAGANWLFSAKWDKLEELKAQRGIDEDLSANLQQYLVGIRIGIRWDK